jgi:photosystem II stability/assembly factor-like uncharacterized protein
MKPSFFILLFLLATIIITTSACRKEQHAMQPVDKWEKLHAPYCGKPLEINFITAKTGCVLGMAYGGGDSTDYNIILKTTDGGNTWQSIYLSHRFLIDTLGSMSGGAYLDLDDPNTVYVAGRNGLMRSEDEGKHWENTNIYNRIQTPAMHFFDSSNGISLQGIGIYKTIDSGKTWQVVYNPDAFAFSFTMLQFTSRQTGYAAGGVSFDDNNFGMMVKTTDGGNTWQQIDYPFHDIIGMSFINDKLGYISVDLSSSGSAGGPPFTSGCELYKTTDGGKTWSLINKDFQNIYGGNAY